MEHPKNDDYYVSKVIEDLEFIVANTRGIDSGELNRNPILLDSMMFRMIQISENIKKLSGEYKDLHPTVPWTQIYGLRNRIVHDYGHVNTTIIYQTLKNDIPALLEILTE